MLIPRASSPGALGNISGKLRQSAEGRWEWKREEGLGSKGHAQGPQSGPMGPLPNLG